MHLEFYACCRLNQPADSEQFENNSFVAFKDSADFEGSLQCRTPRKRANSAR